MFWYTGLKETLTLNMNRFLKNELVTGKAEKDLINLDLCIAENLKPLPEFEICEPTKQTLQKLNANQALVIKKEMQRFYIAVAQYLQKKLPLDNELIHDLTCLHPLSQKDNRSINAKGNIARVIPQVIGQDKVSLI